MLFFWNKKLDKPLVWTKRVKRFFIFLVFFSISNILLCEFIFKCKFISILTPLILSVLLSYINEKILFNFYKNQAKQKIMQNKNLKIICITASYGKTSIKNYLHTLLKSNFKAYMTPRSVNTIAGIVMDINTNLNHDINLYIAEAGARQKGDILEITNLLNPQIAVVGKIGSAHLEYFKTLENIRNTKLEILSSNRLEKAFIHENANVKEENFMQICRNEAFNKICDLEKISFDLKINGDIFNFTAPILGEFNIENLVICIKVCLYLGIDIKTIQQNFHKLKNTQHRLQKLNVKEKLIIDDSFNGNFDGMSSSYKLISIYEGRKVLITPGIIESSKENNKKLSLIINDIFDIVVITSKENLEIFQKNIKKPKLYILKEKTNLQNLLSKITKKDDLILFSNDAPSFI